MQVNVWPTQKWNRYLSTPGQRKIWTETSNTKVNTLITIIALIANRSCNETLVEEDKRKTFTSDFYLKNMCVYNKF